MVQAIVLACVYIALPIAVPFATLRFGQAPVCVPTGRCRSAWFDVEGERGETSDDSRSPVARHTRSEFDGAERAERLGKDGARLHACKLSTDALGGPRVRTMCAWGLGA